MLGSYVSKGMTVLDVGCGLGFFSIGLARLVGHKGCVIAADVQSKMLKVMQKRSEKAGVSNIIRPFKSKPGNPTPGKHPHFGARFSLSRRAPIHL